MIWTGKIVLRIRVPGFFRKKRARGRWSFGKKTVRRTYSQKAGRRAPVRLCLRKIVECPKTEAKRREHPEAGQEQPEAGHSEQERREQPEAVRLEPGHLEQECPEAVCSEAGQERPEAVRLEAGHLEQERPEAARL